MSRVVGRLIKCKPARMQYGIDGLATVTNSRSIASVYFYCAFMHCRNFILLVHALYVIEAFVLVVARMLP